VSTTFELPIRKNSLVKAFEESRESREADVIAEKDITELYIQHFVSKVPPITEQPPKFDFVSFTNPTIGTSLQSNTMSA